MLFRTLVTLYTWQYRKLRSCLQTFAEDKKHNIIHHRNCKTVYFRDIIKALAKLCFVFQLSFWQGIVIRPYNTLIFMLTASKIIIDSLANAGIKLFLISVILTHTDCIFLLLLNETNFESLPSIWRLKSFCKAVRVFNSVLREKFTWNLWGRL